MRIERELMRGAGPLAVLKLLQRREMYGYELVETLAKQSGGVLAMGQSTLYPMLYNLEAQGYIEGVWRETDAAGAGMPGGAKAGSGGGRDRKYYRLTGSGKKRLAKDTQQFQRLASALADLGVLPTPSPSTGG